MSLPSLPRMTFNTRNSASYRATHVACSLRQLPAVGCSYRSYRPLSVGLRNTSISQKQSAPAVTTSFPTRQIMPRSYVSSATATATAQQKSSASLTWSDFLKLRRIRRRFNVIASAFLSTASLGIGIELLRGQDLEQLSQLLFDINPFVLMPLWATGFAGIGWIVGPSIGGGIFRLAYRSKLPEMRVKETDFLNRIRKYRVDPASSSMQNPLPDYYGEKITSVSGYRRWLKDQRAFNKKRQTFV